MNAETIRKLINCVNIIKGYGHFKEGQDGYRALEILEKELLNELQIQNPLGYCPHCDASICKESAEVIGSVVCYTGHVVPKNSVRKY